MSVVLLADLVTVSSVTDVLQIELALATQLNLPVTSWQPLDPSRTIFQINANLASESSSLVAQTAQGGYASYAALMPAGASPYNDGAGYLTTWMDLAGTQFYNVSRIQAGLATGPVPITNTSGIAYSYGGTNPALHFQNPTSGTTYSTTGTGTVSAAGGSQTIQVSADAAFAGAVGTTSVGQTLVMLTPLPGVSVQAQTVALVGTPIETNAHYLTRCQAKLGTLSPNGPAQAFFFVASSVPVFNSLLPDGITYFTAPTPQNPYGVTAPVTRVNVVLNIGSGIINVYAGDAAGALAGSVQNPITALTTSGVPPAVTVTVTTQNAHNLSVGNWAELSGIRGATGANNLVALNPAWQVTGTPSGTQFKFVMTTNPGVYTGGGIAECGDIGMVDAAIQAQCVPTGQIAIVQPASTYSLNVTATVYLKAAAGIPPANAITSIQNTLTAYLASLPIGGVNAEANGIIPWSELISQIASANTGTVSVVLAVPSGDVILTASQAPVLGTATITIVLV